MIEFLPISQGNCLAFRIKDSVSAEQEQHWIDELQAIIDECGKVRLLMILDDSAHWGVKAGVKDLKFAVTHANKLEKLAIVSSSSVMKWLVGVDSFFAKFMNIGEKHFSPEQQAEAWEWLQQ